jgi:hypothetical protein
MSPIIKARKRLFPDESEESDSCDDTSLSRHGRRNEDDDRQKLDLLHDDDTDDDLKEIDDENKKEKYGHKLDDDTDCSADIEIDEEDNSNEVKKIEDKKTDQNEENDEEENSNEEEKNKGKETDQHGDKDKDDDTNDDANRSEDSDCDGDHVIVKDFEMMIPAQVWERIKPQTVEGASSRYKYRLRSREWTHAFNKVFMEHHPTCTVIYDSHSVNQEGKGRFHVIVNSHCKKTGCSMTFRMYVKNQPEPGEDCRVIVKPSGRMHHDPNEDSKRPLSGPLRVLAKKELKHTKPSALVTKKYADPATIKDAITAGNLTQVQSTKVYQTARAEVSSVSLTQARLTNSYLRCMF